MLSSSSVPVQYMQGGLDFDQLLDGQLVNLDIFDNWNKFGQYLLAVKENTTDCSITAVLWDPATANITPVLFINDFYDYGVD